MNYYTKSELEKMKVIGKILAYQLKMEKDPDNSGITMITIDYDNEVTSHDVVKIIDQGRGLKIYVTNDWNHTYDDAQRISENYVKEFIPYE